MIIAASSCFHRNNLNLAGIRCKYEGHAVKTLPLRVITVGKNRSRGTQLLVDEYAGKLNYYCRFEVVLVRSNPKNAHDVLAQIEGEDMAVMNLIKPNDMVIIFDEVGEDINSRQMADLIGDAGLTGASRIVFCIGGPYGHGIRSRKRANKLLKLSSLTLNHQIALVVLMEQLYRAWTILKGQKYHH
ncbi:hypothetical protein Drorol1_Dr00017096 [Drosera rotundifolia]